ncbi:hypothetical protein DSCO28_40440 [Desulfosarcina ovata subsp. sediminis]|uniref:Uncharacterized protein n=1 Tax=Desulfosarcina ovata subsp. sediminis TaxID=885957 RepID=A0A5K7ZTE6_9BACT|nr:hypothetical protein [Desulfosarcina ovata]BBO83478.1 hypothetical protein DSCO28_40440 [Desulfosarcina ovata subsp. sediminis]
MLAEDLFSDLFSNGENTDSKPTDTIAKLDIKEIIKQPEELSIDFDSIASPSEDVIPTNFNQSMIVRGFEQKASKREKELQWWLGTILDIKETCFKASIVDLDGRESLVELDINTLPENQRDKIQLNSKFTYSIRCRQTYMGSLEHFSRINLFSKRNWHPEYENFVQDVTYISHGGRIIFQFSYVFVFKINQVALNCHQPS